MSHESTLRFSDRAGHYRLYRPEYPKEILQFLQDKTGLNTNSKIADIGSGTGIFTKLFIDSQHEVYAVEPNKEMRFQAEESLKANPNFHSINGTAEQTNLPGNFVDIITVAQAFHWFNPDETRKEFERILKQGGHILLVWNIMQSNTPFLKAYNELKEYYAHTIVHTHRANLERIQEIFAPSPVLYHTLDQYQTLDMRGLIGHLESFSTTPQHHEEIYPEMISKLKALFNQYQQNSTVEIMYETKLYLISI